APVVLRQVVPAVVAEDAGQASQGDGGRAVRHDGDASSVSCSGIGESGERRGGQRGLAALLPPQLFACRSAYQKRTSAPSPASTCQIFQVIPPQIVLMTARMISGVSTHGVSTNLRIMQITVSRTSALRPCRRGR